MGPEVTFLGALGAASDGRAGNLCIMLREVSLATILIGRASRFEMTSLPPLEDEHQFKIIERVAEAKRTGEATRSPAHDLYHYTNSKGLLGIIETGCIYATHVAFLNDATEYKHAGDLFFDVANARFGAASSAQQSIISGMLRNLERAKPENYYPFSVACLSEASDSLSQWRGYGEGEGGFALHFDAGELRKCLSRERGAFLAPVLYSDDLKRRLAFEVFDWGVRECERHVGGISADRDRDFIRVWTAHFIYRFSSLAPLIKHQAFCDEAEWRIILEIIPPIHQRRFIFSPRARMLSGHLPLNIGVPPELGSTAPPRLPLKSLVVGPSPYAGLSAMAARALLDNHGYSAVAVRISDVPYRVT